MKNRNILTKALTGFVLVASTVSCGENFLNEKMYSNYGVETTDVNAKVLAIHQEYRAAWGRSWPQGYNCSFQIGTDACTPGQFEGTESPFFKYAELTPTSTNVRLFWSSNYNIINKSNIVINSDPTYASKAQIAEGKFFRAYAYNMLVTFYGAVPLVTESTEVPRTDYVRNPVSDINAQIVEDIEYAIENLPELGSAPAPSRANKDMARQLAAEIYLRIGMTDDSYFKKAEDVITPIIESGNYKLITERYGIYLNEGGDAYRDMFRFGNQRRSQGNTEGIWILENEYNANIIGGTQDSPQQRRCWGNSYHNIDGMQNCDSLGGRGLGRMRLSNYVKYNLFSDNDIRNSNYNIRRKLYVNKPDFDRTYGIDANGFRVAADDSTAIKTITVKTGDYIPPAAADTVASYTPYTTKWGGYDPTDDFGYAIVKDWSLMRLGETYLLRAEARFRQNNLSGAAEDINVLRDRAFKEARITNPDAGKVTASDITLDFILDERLRELIGEENRRQTLIRTNSLGDRIEKFGETNAALKNYSIEGFEEFNTLFPIPETEILLNKDAVLEQNPGYINK